MRCVATWLKREPCQREAVVGLTVPGFSPKRFYVCQLHAAACRNVLQSFGQTYHETELPSEAAQQTLTFGPKTR
jgi:hypothetical protein